MNAKKIIYVVLGLLAVVALSRWLGGPSEETVPVVDPDVESVPSFEAVPGDVDPEAHGEESGHIAVPGDEEEESDMLRDVGTERSFDDIQDRLAIPGTSFLPAQANTLTVWLAQGEPEGSKDREIWLARGLALARERQARMREWMRTDPERALEESVTPRMYAALPEAVQALVERPVYEEGGYEIILGDLTVRHGHQAVIVDDGAGAAGGRFAVYYRGEVHYADTRAEAEQIRASLQ